MISSILTFIVGLDIKIITIGTSLVAPIVFTILHYLAQKSIDDTRAADKKERVINSFEERMERFLEAASKLTYRELDEIDAEEIENIKIDAYAKYRAVKRFWVQHGKELEITPQDISVLERKVSRFLYHANSRAEWKALYGKSEEEDICLLDVCEDLVDQARGAIDE